jgi:hypothetical protein
MEAIMKIRALRTFRGDVGTVRRDAKVEIQDTHARSLIQRGLAVEIEEEPKAGAPAKKPKPRVKARAKPSTKGA